ncbi:DUF4003 family protein [Muricomes intestini]|uniref:DUF4003 family protein n=1 Tax=Muricomes intestini TaxID=1796634 RepID=UPI002FDF0D75
MNELTRKRCEQLIDNRDKVKSVFAWDGGLIQLCCAGIYSEKGKNVDVAELKRSKELLKEKVGIFSNFRGTACSPIASMLAVSGNPEGTLDKGLKVYELLKKEFWSSSYLPLAAMVLARMAEPYQYKQIAVRTREIYNRMKAEHPFLTSGEDSALCALMALSEKTDDELIEDIESCYQILKGNFLTANSVQSLSHVLALYEGTAQEKCDRTMALFYKLKESGRKYGTEYELPTLGVLAMTGADLDEVVLEMAQIDDWLSGQKGFGLFGSVTRKQRLMYAGILAEKDYIEDSTLQTAAVNGTIAVIIAQEAAMCAAIAASSAAAANNGSSN